MKPVPIFVKIMMQVDSFSKVAKHANNAQHKKDIFEVT